MLKKLDENIITYLEKQNIRVYEHIIWSAGEKLINNFLKKQYELNNNEKLVIFIVDDYEGKIQSYKNQIIVRTSLNRTLKLKNEIILPYIWECSKTRFSPLSKTDLPIVSFCGIPTKYRIQLIRKIKRFKSQSSTRCLKKLLSSISIPFTSTLPFEGFNNPKIIPIVVVFPQPFGPSIPMISL